MDFIQNQIAALKITQDNYYNSLLLYIKNLEQKNKELEGKLKDLENKEKDNNNKAIQKIKS